jgi:hypothetical protein
LNLGVFDRKHILLGSIHPDFDIIQLDKWCSNDFECLCV